MNLRDYKFRAIRHLFEYLDARPGKTLIVFEKAYFPIIHDINQYTISAGRSDDIEICFIEKHSPKELYKKLESSEKFLCAYNLNWEEGATDHMKIISECLALFENKAYTISDMSAAFYDIFQACPSLISELNKKLIRSLQVGKLLEIRDANGSYLKIHLDEFYDWVNMDCFSEASFDLACNLPVGEVATYAPKVEGELFFTGSLLGTMPIGRNHGVIKNPVYFKIEDNAIVEIKADNMSLQQDLEYCLYFDEYTHLVNEVAVGTNYAIPKPLQGYNYKYEENQFGFHLGFGASLAQQNVVRKTPHHLDLVFASSTVFLDDKLLFDGDYHLDNFPESEKDVPLRLSKRTCCSI